MSSGFPMRPIGVARNSLYLPARKNVDLRYTRWIPLHGTTRAEIIMELKNVFNTEQMASISTTVAVNALGNPVAPIPSDPYQFPNPSGYEQQVPARLQSALLSWAGRAG